MAAAALLSVVLAQAKVSPLWLIALGLVVGWFLNERERKRINASIAARRSTGKA
jgi:chromate transport protein ChrA